VIYSGMVFILAHVGCAQDCVVGDWLVGVAAGPVFAVLCFAVGGERRHETGDGVNGIW
jgi:hypothetical protein